MSQEMKVLNQMRVWYQFDSKSENDLIDLAEDEDVKAQVEQFHREQIDRGGMWVKNRYVPTSRILSYELIEKTILDPELIRALEAADHNPY